MKTKHPVDSLTLAFNAAVLFFLLLEQNLTLLQPLVSPRIYVWLAIGVPIVNMLLRARTTSAISMAAPRKGHDETKPADGEP